MRFAPLQARYSLPLLSGLAAFLALPALAGAAPPDPPAQSDTTVTEGTRTTDLKEFRYEFGLTAGAHFFNSQSGLGRFTNDPSDLSPKTAVALGARLALNFNRWVSVEGEAVAIPSHTVRDPNGTKLTVFGYRGSVLVHLVPSGPIRPFVLVGYGGMSSITNDSSVVPSDTDGYFHAGVGFKIAIGDHAGLRLDGRIMAPPAFLGKDFPVGNETGYHGPDWEALGGFFINFGEIESVNQTIVKKEVIVMPAPPPIDPDGDGIVGKADKCPNDPEDKDGFQDADGCPDPDNDMDGIPDVRDKCPNDAEDKDGFEDADGCPDPDNDKDAIPDVSDKCPNEPETRNGYQDSDGCPDEVPAAIKKFTGVIEGINFKTAQATILPGSFAILDRAVALLKEYPDIRLEIAGHTDSKGKADYNRDLSQRRADSVKMYFITNGIDGGRLTTIGYGLDRPIADNATEAGRSKNRRTEFRLLVGDEGKPGAAPAGAPAAAPASSPAAPSRAPYDSGPPPTTP